MPTQAETVANNTPVLDVVDAKMAALDAALARLDDLSAKRAALAESVADLKKQEAEHLRNDAANEDDAVQNLIQLRARIDVQSARVASLDNQIKEQQAQVVSIGNDAGNAANTLWRQLVANRSARALAIFDANFEMPWGARFPKSEFIDNSKLVREIRHLSPRFADYQKPVENRIEQLRGFGKEFIPLREACEKEPDLALTPVGAPALSVIGKAA
jgi:chorismate mutase